MLVADNYDFSNSLIGLHEAMSLANLTEAEDPRRLGVEPASRPPIGWKQLAEEKVADRCCNLGRVSLQRKVSSVEETNECTRNITFKGLGTRRQEKRVVLTPHREQRRLVLAEIFLEGGIKRDVSFIVTE